MTFNSSPAMGIMTRQRVCAVEEIAGRNDASTSRGPNQHEQIGFDMAKRPIPTPEDLRQLLRYDPEAGRLFWKERGPKWFSDGRQSARHRAGIWNTKYSGSEAFTAASKGYRIGRVFNVLLKAHRVAWAIHYGEWPDGQVDHINHDRSDNRIDNLRRVTQTQNSYNTPLRATNTSGQTGVWRGAADGTWVAQIGSGDTRKYLGSFKSFEEAVSARKQAERSQGVHKNHGRAKVKSY